MFPLDFFLFQLRTLDGWYFKRDLYCWVFLRGKGIVTDKTGHQILDRSIDIVYIQHSQNWFDREEISRLLWILGACVDKVDTSLQQNQWTRFHHLHDQQLFGRMIDQLIFQLWIVFTNIGRNIGTKNRWPIIISKTSLRDFWHLHKSLEYLPNDDRHQILLR